MAQRKADFKDAPHLICHNAGTSPRWGSLVMRRATKNRNFRTQPPLFRRMIHQGEFKKGERVRAIDGALL